MMTTLNSSTVTLDEKNQWLGKLAFSALVALKLSQGDGKTGHNAQSENLFLLRWLQTALKQKRFHRCVAHDLIWLTQLAQQRLMTSKQRSRLEYLWRSCCCEIQDQSDLFRLTYATELLKDLGWDSVVLSQGRWDKLIATKLMNRARPTFYVTQRALAQGFSEEGKLIQHIDFFVQGDEIQFITVLKQHHLQGKYSAATQHYHLLTSGERVRDDDAVRKGSKDEPDTRK